VSASKLDTPSFASRRFGLSRSHDVLKLKTAFIGETTSRGSLRGPIREFSRASQNRLAEYCDSIDWVSLGCLLFITLTYPSVFPTDGKVTEYHLDKFRHAWLRKYGAPVGIHKQEFQHRGALHFHLVLVGNGIDVGECRRWVAQTWFDIVGSGDRAHFFAGTEVDFWRSGNPASYLSKYFGGGKGYQNIVPDGFINPGRFWGAWGLRPKSVFTDLSEREFIDIRRIFRKIAKSKKMRLRSPGRLQGQWFYFRDSSKGCIIEQLGAVIGRPLLLC
jgi:hypothetical protein